MPASSITTANAAQVPDGDALRAGGNAVTIRGVATDNGVSTLYVIEAVDDGEPGLGADSLSIQTGTGLGFIAGGVTTNGNVQVR